MDDAEYERLADAVMQRIEAGLDAAEGDFEHELAAGGLIEIECPDGSKIVVNKQAAAREIWVAARSGGFHYRWDGAQWRDTRSGEELFAALERLLAEQGAGPVRFP
jgi:CyaY protein